MAIKRDKYKMFRISRPFGYHPDDVEKKISQYENALTQVNEKYIEQVQKNNQLIEKINKLQDELREMHLQMSCLELPDVDEAVEHYVLNDFKNYNNPEAKDYPDPPEVKDASNDHGIVIDKNECDALNDDSDENNDNHHKSLHINKKADINDENCDFDPSFIIDGQNNNDDGDDDFNIDIAQ